MQNAPSIAVENDPGPTRGARRALASGALRRLMAALAIACLTTGCGALLLVGGAGTSAIAFATGELRASEEAPLSRVHEATRLAVETLGYQEVEATLADSKIRWKGTTPSGDPVDIRLIAKGPELTDVRIRIGVFGNEGRSRLVLEQIRQSL